MAIVAIAAPAAAAVPSDLRFRIVREGSVIGTHHVALTGVGSTTTASTEVDIAVRIAGITVFRLTHRFEEVVESGRLMRVTSRLERQGRVRTFTARAEGGAILVEGTDGPQRLSADALPLTWWDATRTGRPLFSNDTGKPLRLAWTRGARPAGGTLWRCTGDEDSEGGYAADGTWLDWTTKGEDGSTVIYTRA